MSNLNQMFQNRNNVSSSSSAYSPILTFREMFAENNSTISSKHDRTPVVAAPISPMELGLSLALLDKEIFASKQLDRADIDFLASITAKAKKKKKKKTQRR